MDASLPERALWSFWRSAAAREAPVNSIESGQYNENDPSFACGDLAASVAYGSTRSAIDCLSFGSFSLVPISHG